jgi:hypothetical protein
MLELYYKNGKVIGYINYKPTVADPKVGNYCYKIKNKIISQYIGLVIDFFKHIFHSNKLGFFYFTLPEGVRQLEESEITHEYYAKIKGTPKLPTNLDFGCSYILNKYYKKDGLLQVFINTFPEAKDTLLSLIFFKLMVDFPYSYAETWFNSSYCTELYKTANLESPRITEFLKKLGERVEIFNDEYFKYLSLENALSLLMDSTGLGNDIDIDLAAVNNHNGLVSNETRFIVMYDINLKNMLLVTLLISQHLKELLTG